jgi:segregation and condensation protein A
MGASHFLKLDKFEGPLDLLLHLIKVHEIDVFDIDVFLLTQQYLDYLRLVDFADLSDASEFLDMAATLIEIKSRMLLPRPTVVTQDGQIVEEDPRESLQRRLIEYERYRRAAEELSSRPQIGVQIMLNNEYKRLEKVYEGVEAPILGDAATLCILYEQILVDLADRKEEPRVRMHRHVVNIDQVRAEIRRLMETVTFTLFQGFYHRFRTRYEMVINIMAILEMAKSNELKIYQQEPKGPMWLHREECDVTQFSIEGATARPYAEAAVGVMFAESDLEGESR